MDPSLSGLNMVPLVALSFLAVSSCGFFFTVGANNAKAYSLPDCARSCQSQHGCLKFEFESRKRACFFHTTKGFSENSENQEQVEIGLWTCRMLWPSTTDVSGLCSDDAGIVGQKCTTKRVKKTSVCVKADITPPEGHCPVPSKLDNANISPGGLVPGSTRNYTCLEGYLDTQSFVSSGVSTCLPDFTWSNHNLTCSGQYIRQNMKSEDADIFQEFKHFKEVSGNTSSFVFFAKACRDSSFALCDVLQVAPKNCYIVSIGSYGNSRFDIRKPGGGMTVYKKDEHILSCKEFRPFWISWRKGTIAVGKGNTVGSLEVLRWKPAFLPEIVSAGPLYTHEEVVWFFLKQK